MFEMGKKIGIVATSGPMDADVVLAGEKFFKDRGYDVLIAPSCFERLGYLAGASDESRALDVMMMFADDEIGAIVCMRGGYGSNRLVPYFEGFDFARYAKPFIGYSDVTYLHVYFQQRHGLATYHGPMLKDLLTGNDLTVSSFLDVFMAGQSLQLNGVSYFDEEVGATSGIVIGGNLSIVCSTLGTPYEIDACGKVLFFEEVNEEAYAIDRLLVQLVYAGKINDCAGIVLGDFNAPDKAAVHDTIRKILMPFGKPIAYGISSGHCVPNLTIPLGVQCVLDSGAGEVRFTKY